MTNDISLSLDLINVKDSQNFYVGVSKPRLSVLGCLRQYNLNETSNYIVFIFFPNSALRNQGCGLSMDAAYTRTFTVTSMPREGSGKQVSHKQGRYK